MTKQKIIEKLLGLKCQNEVVSNCHNFYINSDDVITVGCFKVVCYYLDGFKEKWCSYSEIASIEIYNTYIIFILKNKTKITVER